MRDLLETRAASWAREVFDEEKVAAVLLPPEPDDRAGVYTVALAVRDRDTWRACEIWLEEDEVTLIFGKGECLPPDGVEWPWE